MHSVLHDPSGGDEMCSDDNDEGGEDLLDFDSLFDEMMEEKDPKSTVWKQDPARCLLP